MKYKRVNNNIFIENRMLLKDMLKDIGVSVSDFPDHIYSISFHRYLTEKKDIIKNGIYSYDIVSSVYFKKLNDRLNEELEKRNKDNNNL